MKKINVIMAAMLLIISGCTLSPPKEKLQEGTVEEMRTFSSTAAQEYEFTLDTPPLNFGTYATDGSYTVNVDFRSNYTSDRNLGSQIFTYGPDDASFSWDKDDPFISFNANGKNLTAYSAFAYEKLVDGNWHTLTFRIGTSQDILLDSILIASRSNVGKPINAKLIFSTDWVNKDDPAIRAPRSVLSGTLRNIALVNGFLTFRRENQPPPLQYDSLDFPNGFNYSTGDLTNVKPASDQWKDFPDPPWKGANQAFVRSATNFTYFCGYKQPGVTDDQMLQELVSRYDIANRKYHYNIRLDNMNDISQNTRFYSGLISLARANPNLEVEISSQISQLYPQDGVKPHTKDELNRTLPNVPLTFFDPEKYCYGKTCQKASITLNGLKIGLVSDNGEMIPFWNDTNQFYKKEDQLTAAQKQCIADKQSSGLSWKQYTSKKYTDVVTYIMSAGKPYFPNAVFSEYDVWSYGDSPLFSERIRINTDGRGTISFYPTANEFVFNGAGNRRGLKGYYFKSKVDEISQGHEWNIPYGGAGWDNDMRKNVPFGCLEGAQVSLMAGGIYSYNSAYFTLTGWGSTGFQDPKGYVYQLAAFPYVWASLSSPKIWDMYLNSELMPGDMRDEYYVQNPSQIKFNYMYWSGKKSIRTYIRRVKTVPHTYFIFSTRRKYGIHKSVSPRQLPAVIYFQGDSVRFNSKMQGVIYQYNDSTKELKQISHLFYAHPDRKGAQLSDQ